MPCVEVGWRLASAHWGHGYAPEAARAALAFGFDDVGLDEIVSFTTAAQHQVPPGHGEARHDPRPRRRLRPPAASRGPIRCARTCSTGTAAIERGGQHPTRTILGGIGVGVPWPAWTGTPIVLLLHGPNLNLLGDREPEVYGTATLADHVATAERSLAEHGLAVESFQSNHEGELVDAIHGARRRCAAIIINPGAFTHYAWSIHDALAAFDGPVVELHLSNPNAREPWRHTSVVAPVAKGSIVGFGGHGYELAAAPSPSSWGAGREPATSRRSATPADPTPCAPPSTAPRCSCVRTRSGSRRLVVRGRRPCRRRPARWG